MDDYSIRYGRCRDRVRWYPVAHTLIVELLNIGYRKQGMHEYLYMPVLNMELPADVIVYDFHADWSSRSLYVLLGHESFEENGVGSLIKPQAAPARISIDTRRLLPEGTP